MFILLKYYQILYVILDLYLGSIPVADVVTPELPALEATKKSEVPAPPKKVLSNIELLATIASLERQLKEEKREKEELKEEKYKLNDLYIKARDHNQSLAQENESLKRTIREKNKQIKKLMNKNLTRNEHYKVFKEVLSPAFTEAQINCLWKKDWQRCREWSHDDYSIAITLRCISAKAYKFLRKSRMVPLPGKAISAKRLSIYFVLCEI